MKLSVIVSIFNEEHVIRLFYDELMLYVPREYEYEIVFVNDGSTDDSQKIISEIISENNHAKSILFSRNFGHEAAMLAGIDHATGDILICMDSDLQHPPALIPEMINRFRQGNVDVINMVRKKNTSIFSAFFYKLIKIISPFNIEADASDFFLISKKIAKILKNNYRERVRFLRGFIQMLGFNKTTMLFDVGKRAEGESKYSFLKLLTLSFTAISTLSKLPLKLGIYIGFLSGIFGIVLSIYSIIMKIIQQPVSGYTTIIVFLSLMFSIQFFILGVIGEYIGFLFDEQKKRPIYIIDSTTNMGENDEVLIG
ncbi:MAG: glycosyltransferase family 2 protein [Lentimicrobium sp.]|jgi:dolichol-phosphate mannosyltransferase|nr:glycosyltransferase family 2 protein [Lentimicrobium sp.]